MMIGYKYEEYHQIIKLNIVVDDDDDECVFTRIESKYRIRDNITTTSINIYEFLFIYFSNESKKKHFTIIII